MSPKGERIFEKQDYVVSSSQQIYWNAIICIFDAITKNALRPRLPIPQTQTL